MENEDGFILKELSYEVLGCAFDAFKKVGVGFDEIRYHKVFHEYLLRKNLAYNDKVCITDTIENIQFSPFEIDYWLLEKSLLVGILAGKDKPRAYDFLRMRSYLKSLHLHHGLIAYWSVKNFQLYGIYES